MEEGFPGTIHMEVVFTWTNKNEVIIAYTASTDKKSVINVTNHAYFNLHGAGTGDIFDHEMTLNASEYTPIDATQIPTGEIRPVKGTPFDFTSARTFGSRVGDTYEGSVFLDMIIISSLTIKKRWMPWFMILSAAGCWK